MAQRHAYPTKTIRTIGTVEVHRWRMAGDSGTGYEEYQYAAYVPVGSSFESPYSTITSRPEGRRGWLGQLGTERPTPELDALPARTSERYERVMAYFQANHEQAYRYIVDAFPEAEGGRRDVGRIGLTMRCPEHRCTMACYREEA